MIAKIDEFIISLFQKYLVNLTGKKPIWLAQQCVYLMTLVVVYGAFFVNNQIFSLITGVIMVFCFWLQTHNEMLWDITQKMSRAPFQMALRLTIIFLWLMPTLVIILTSNVSISTINTSLVWSTVFVVSYLEACENPPPPEPKRKLVLDNS